MHFVTKTYGHECGLSACFRQWRAKSHCRFLHGYPLSFKFTFAASKLDENGWVINFGDLKPIKAWLEQTFDHKLLIAKDDPDIKLLRRLGVSYQGGNDGTAGQLAQVVELDAVGCEAFAKLAWDFVQRFLEEEGYSGRVSLTEVEVREHSSNGVIYTGER